MAEKLPQSPPVLPELELIYGKGNAFPREAPEMLGKLKGKIRESYIAKLTADEAEKKKRRMQRSTPQTKEKPFDPHSVASDQTVKQQKSSLEMRNYLAEQGVIPPESVQDTDIDIFDVHAPQYAERGMQKDMDKLIPNQSTEATQKESREGLKKLIEKLTG